jgi:hypothetical protein
MALGVDVRDHVVTLTLDRPEAYNAIDPEMRESIVRALGEAEGSGVRCIVLRGAGRGFCAGIDLRAGAGGRKGPELMDYMRTSTQAIVRAVLRARSHVNRCTASVWRGARVRSRCRSVRRARRRFSRALRSCRRDDLCSASVKATRDASSCSVVAAPDARSG